MYQTRCQLRQAFTLIKLLVVIVIVGLLAGLIFPVLWNAREAARRSSCQSNLRQIGVAIAMYVHDYSDTHPPDNSHRNPPARHIGWAALLQPYLGSTQALQCPSEETPANSVPTSSGYTDYLYNRYALGLRDAFFAFPIDTILCMDGVRGDSAMWDNGTSDAYFDCRGDSTMPSATPGVATWLHRPREEFIFRYAERHGEAANYLFADGHVKSLKPLSVYNNCTEPRGKASFAYR